MKFLTKPYAFLLTFLSFLFIFRPYNKPEFFIFFWKLVVVGTILSCIFNCSHSKKIRITLIFCASAMAILNFFTWILPLKLIISIFFITVCNWSIIKKALTKDSVDFETLRGILCAYILFAVAFTYIFWLIELTNPHSFHSLSHTIQIFPYVEFISKMLYFSFITLLTIGFGDIVPITSTAQTAVVIEGLIGQFYIAILVAKLVSSYSDVAKIFIKNRNKD